MNKFVFTCGDPNGIGPEILLKTLAAVYNKRNSYYITAPRKLIDDLNHSVKLPLEYYKSIAEVADSKTKAIRVLDISGGRISHGTPTKTSGMISFESLETACDLAGKLDDAALITAPISKEAWELNSINYEGHTDYLGERYGADPLMLFYSTSFIAGLVTIHKPVKSVPAMITSKRISRTIEILLKSLKRDFGIKFPSVAVLGLNPHAGEKGRIGIEETKIIEPSIKRFRKEKVDGPFVPDAFFGTGKFKNYDAVLGMYHDQVLIPFKLLHFENGVNFTANLSIIRTSPDHGTAFDIAGKNIANPRSMIESYKLARKVLSNRKKR